MDVSVLPGGVSEYGAMMEFLHAWIPGKSHSVSGDAPKLRGLLCGLGFHSPYYKYDGSLFPVHLGWHCRCCEKKITKAINYRWVQRG